MTDDIPAQIDALAQSFIAKAMELGMDAVTVRYSYHRRQLVRPHRANAGVPFRRAHIRQSRRDQDQERTRVQIRNTEGEDGE